jgi:hypothetical protein
VRVAECERAAVRVCSWRHFSVCLCACVGACACARACVCARAQVVQAKPIPARHRWHHERRARARAFARHGAMGGRRTRTRARAHSHTRACSRTCEHAQAQTDAWVKSVALNDFFIVVLTLPRSILSLTRPRPPVRALAYRRAICTGIGTRVHVRARALTCTHARLRTPTRAHARTHTHARIRTHAYARAAAGGCIAQSRALWISNQGTRFS